MKRAVCDSAGCDGKDFKAYPVPFPCRGKGHLPLDPVAPGPVQPDFEHFQGRCFHGIGME